MMDRETFNTFCASLPHTTHVIQWDGADVWKIGGKMFAIGAWSWGAHAGITFKVSEIAYDILRDMPGLRPAPYLASRGLKWIQHYAAPGLDDAALGEQLRASYILVVRKLTRTLRSELGLEALVTRR